MSTDPRQSQLNFVCFSGELTFFGPRSTTAIYEEEVGSTVFNALLLVLRLQARLYCEALRELRLLIPTGCVELLLVEKLGFF